MELNNCSKKLTHMPGKQLTFWALLFSMSAKPDTYTSIKV